jgi:hypothetical protein
MTDFVSAPSIVTDPAALTDNAIDAVNANLTGNGYAGWTANDAALAVILISTIAQMLADAGASASVVLAAVFRSFGTQLFGIPYQQGASATVLTTWTFTSPAPAAGYTIPSGTAVIVSGYAFYVQTGQVTATSATNASILLVASANGTLYNDLGGVNTPVSSNDELDWVSSIITLGLTSGGADQETDTDYQNRLVAVLQLQAPRPVVAADFAAMVLSDVAQSATGVAVGRATTLDGYFPDGRVLSTGGAGSTVLSCTTTNTSVTVTYTGTGNQVPTVGATVTGTGIPAGATVAPTPAPTESTFTLSISATASGAASLTVGATSGYGPVHLTCTGTTTNTSPAISALTAPWLGAIPDVGARVTGTGIPAGATVLGSPTPTTAAFTISANATSSNTGETITVSSWTTVQLANCTAVTDVAGNALSAASMDALLAWLETFRPQNWLNNLVAPSSSTIYVTTQIHVLPGYNAGAVAGNVQSALLAYLNPAAWGNPQTSSTGSNAWLNSGQGFNLVRLNKLIGVVENVPGVDYIPPGRITLGLSASPSGTADLTLSGPFPLPSSTSGTIAVSTV